MQVQVQVRVRVRGRGRWRRWWYRSTTTTSTSTSGWWWWWRSRSRGRSRRSRMGSEARVRVSCGRRHDDPCCDACDSCVVCIPSCKLGILYHFLPPISTSDDDTILNEYGVANVNNFWLEQAYEMGNDEKVILHITYTITTHWLTCHIPASSRALIYWY